jgi:radical SAM superfamily enzyme YgiQ (UPF0313 family)
MAKVLFISQPFEDLGIEYLSAALKQRQHSVFLLIDRCLFYDSYQRRPLLHNLFDEKKKLFRRIDAIAPDLIALSVMTDTYQWALDIATQVKKRYPFLPLIVGGPHPTLVPEKVIENECIDMLCVGEGEKALYQLADALDKKEDYRRIDNLWVKIDGAVYKNKPQLSFRDLNILPFPDKQIYYDQLPIFKPEYLIMTSRGCCYQCSYCCTVALKNLYADRYFRRRSPAHVIAELEHAKIAFSPRFIWFMDDSFAHDEQWLDEFCAAYKNKINIPFFCYLHPNEVNQKSASLIRSAGCQEVGVGVQAISESTLKIIGRPYNAEDIEHAFSILNNVGIACVAENILGLPGEGEHELTILSQLYNKIKYVVPIFSSLRLFPKTPLSEKIVAETPRPEFLEKAINEGLGGSMALGGTLPIDGNQRKLAAAITLSSLMPFSTGEFIIKRKLYRFFPKNTFLFSSFIARLLLISPFSKWFGKKQTYDAGLKRYVRIYLNFFFKINFS